MPTREEVTYFGAGPAPLPTPVLEAGAKAFLNFEDTGLSLAEISHRSPTATRILADTKSALASLLEIPDDYEILFMHGGGTGEFSAVVFNMVAVWVERRRRQAEKDLNGDEENILERVRREVREDLRLDYLVTGSWSLKASQEATNLLEPLGGDLVNVALDTRRCNNGKFGTIPAESTWNLTPTRKEGGRGSAFVYYCDNETVDGVEFPAFPSILNPSSSSSLGDQEDERLIVADMSSNFVSRRINVKKYAVIFGGAQKNIGITDTTILIVRKSLLAPPAQPPPSFLHAVGIWSPPIIFHWPTIAKNNSLYNTLPIFSIYIAGQVLSSSLRRFSSSSAPLKQEEKKEKRDQEKFELPPILGQEILAMEKAKILYDILDANPDIFRTCAHKEARSRMNICWRIVSRAEHTQQSKYTEQNSASSPTPNSTNLKILTEPGAASAASRSLRTASKSDSAASPLPPPPSSQFTTTSPSLNPSPSLESSFLHGAEERGLLGLKGHRSVGGIRASNYNAVSVEGVKRLAGWMFEFAGREGR